MIAIINRQRLLEWKHGEYPVGHPYNYKPGTRAYFEAMVRFGLIYAPYMPLQITKLK